MLEARRARRREDRELKKAKEKKSIEEELRDEKSELIQAQEQLREAIIRMTIRMTEKNR